MQTFAQSQAEVNRNLIESLRATTLADSRSSATATPTSSVSGPAAAAAAAPLGNFSRCTARFDGRTRDPEVLEAFLDAVETYMECTAVSDEHAVRGLSMLLEGETAVWWRGIKSSVITWRDAAERLRAMYGVPRPAHEMLREMFAAEQEEERSAPKRSRAACACLSCLPYVVPEPMQIDIIYGLLNRRIRKRILRDDIKSVNGLIDRVRVAEDAIRQGGRMYECFLEIAFEAELNTEEHPELMELAPELCNEHPDTRTAAIQELREMVYERGECSPRRLDDAFLLRFLRARHFIVPRAHRQLVRYCTFLEQYPQLYKGVDLWGLAKMGRICEGSMLDRPDVGRLIIMRLGIWDPYEYPVEDLVSTAMAIVEIGQRSPKLQILGGTIIVDLEGTTIKHFSTLTPTVVHQILCIMGLALPSKIKAWHFVNYNWLVNSFFCLYKRFIDKKSWKRIHFHGHDLKSLQQRINPECLPARYGGTNRNHSNIETWLNKIRKYRDECFDREMKEFGWLIK